MKQSKKNMTRQEIVPLLGEFGSIEYNGDFYPSTVVGSMHELLGQIDVVVIKRPDGNPITRPISSIKRFRKLPEPVLTE